MNDEKARDPYNVALGQVLADEIKDQDFGEARMVRATGISRAALRRYLDGDRDIQITRLREIVRVLRVPMSRVLNEAERRVKEIEQRDS